MLESKTENLHLYICAKHCDSISAADNIRIFDFCINVEPKCSTSIDV